MSISICFQEELQSIVEAEMWPGAPAESSLPSHSNTNTAPTPRLQQRRALEGCPRVPVSSFFSPTDPTTPAMAFMAMRKNLDERAKKKELDAIFAKFDHNHNGNIYILIPQPCLTGSPIELFPTKGRFTSKTSWRS